MCVCVCVCVCVCFTHLICEHAYSILHGIFICTLLLIKSSLNNYNTIINNINKNSKLNNLLKLVKVSVLMQLWLIFHELIAVIVTHNNHMVQTVLYFVSILLCFIAC